MQEMTSLERYMAAINGDPMDMYPTLNVSPNWSMMPHWPEILGLNFLHLSHGTEEQRLKFYDVLHDVLGLDYIPCGSGKAYGQRGQQYVTEEDGVPVLVDIGSRSKTRYHEFPPDLPPDEPLFETAADVERLDPPPTAEEMLATGAYDFTKKLIEHFDDTVFLYMGDMAPFPTSFYMLSYDKLFDAMFFQKDLVFALMDRHEEVIRQQCRLARMLGVHGMINALMRVKSNLDSGIPQAIQIAGIEALQESQECIGENNTIYQRRRDKLVDALRGIGMEITPPRASLYVWARVPEGYTSAEFAGMLLEEKDIVVTPGSGYGKYGEGYIRLSLTLSDEHLAKAVQRLEGWKIPPKA